MLSFSGYHQAVSAIITIVLVCVCMHGTARGEGKDFEMVCE